MKKEWEEFTSTFGTGVYMGWNKIGEDKSLVIIEPSDKGDKWFIGLTTPDKDRRIATVKTKTQAIRYAKRWMKNYVRLKKVI